MQKHLDEASKDGVRLEEEILRIHEAQVKQQEQIEKCKIKFTKANEQVVTIAEEIGQ